MSSKKKKYELNRPKSEILTTTNGNLKIDRSIDWKIPLNIDIKSDEVQLVCKSLGFTINELNILQKKFNHYDADYSGEIDMDEFFQWVSEPKTKFTCGIFNAIGKKNINKLNFEDFIMCICIFSTYTKLELLKFCFDMFDTDKSGSLDETEFIKMCQSLHEKESFFNGNFERALKEFDKNKDGLVDFDEFVLINKSFGVAFYPIFRLQKNIQKNSLGERNWNYIIKRINQIDDLLYYMKIHNGALPKLTLFDTFLNKLNGKNKIIKDCLIIYNRNIKNNLIKKNSSNTTINTKKSKSKSKSKIIMDEINNK